jgi:hypothetical protein
MQLILDVIFSSFASGVRLRARREPRRASMWPPDGRFGATTNVGWAAAAVGLLQLALLIALSYRAAATAIRGFDDPMLLVFTLMLFPVFAFLFAAALWMLATAATASIALLWGDRKAWARAFVAATLSFLLGVALIPARSNALAIPLTVVAVADLVLLSLSWPKRPERARP